MGIFDKIKQAIFGHEAHAAPVSETAAAGSAVPHTSTSAPLSPASTQASPSASAPTATPSSSGPVDIEPILDAAVKKKGQHLDWRKSIVDLMKALDLDSSLEARKELAQELHYTGSTDDSATMNVWLHKALMKKLAENGGKVPADLAD
ncbi:DUF3597 domain-containing protein [Neorhizobium lilium]|uniref:DUF3597 domain-containing protein n=1 Tax=Neorhizobium lilium TaxID=2503024 RepID=A0A444LI22_9HYPH|nr:DUF3597 domain-containing protein [Neorhizobium lilium]RWX78605.1 DUF3597 domain-containing protein [Neorhizobium lilium]